MILFYKTYPGSGGYKIKFHVIFNQCCISISPENVKKPLVFLRFQGILKWNTGMKGAIFYLLLLVSLEFIPLKSASKTALEISMAERIIVIPNYH